MKGTKKHYGYCRVSTLTQDTEKQKYELLNYAHANKFQFTQIQEIVISSRKSKKDREINSLLNMLKSEDHLYITKLDRYRKKYKRSS